MKIKGKWLVKSIERMRKSWRQMANVQKRRKIEINEFVFEKFFVDNRSHRFANDNFSKCRLFFDINERFHDEYQPNVDYDRWIFLTKTLLKSSTSKILFLIENKKKRKERKKMRPWNTITLIFHLLVNIWRLNNVRDRIKIRLKSFPKCYFFFYLQGS